jgi:hypothetical protein
MTPIDDSPSEARTAHIVMCAAIIAVYDPTPKMIEAMADLLVGLVSIEREQKVALRYGMQDVMLRLMSLKKEKLPALGLIWLATIRGSDKMGIKFDVFWDAWQWPGARVYEAPTMADLLVGLVSTEREQKVALQIWHAGCDAALDELEERKVTVKRL